MWAGRDLQEIQNVVDATNAVSTPLPYPPARGPPPVSVFAGMTSSEPGATSDDGSDGDDDEDDGDDEATIPDIPGFPLHSSSTVDNRSQKPQLGVQSPQVVPAGLGARATLNLRVDASAQESELAARRRATAGITREKPAPISVLQGVSLSRSSTAAQSEASNVSNASSTFLNPNISQNATAQIMTNPEIQVSINPSALASSRG